MPFTRLRQLAQAADLAAVAIVPGANFRYLTGVDLHLMERPSILFVPVDGESVVILPSLEVSKWENANLPAKVIGWRDDEGYAGAFRQASQALNLDGQQIGVEGLRMRVLEGQLLEDLLGAQVIDADEVFTQLRIIKSPDEIEKHREAIRISEEALQKTLDNLKLGMTEREIATMLSQFQTDLGGGGNSFSPIVLIGARSALPHGVPENIPLQQGDTLLIDFGTVKHGYVSDITRTFFVGEPSAEYRAVYEVVLSANQTGIATAKPRASCEAVDLATSQILKDSDFADYILHRTGHGLGIDVHEFPNITQGDLRELEVGMVFTVEPGLYLAGKLGVRIEDNVVVTADGTECLTSFPKELTVLNLS